MATSVAPRGKSITANLGKQSAFATAASSYLTTYLMSHTLELKQPFVDDPQLGLARTNDRDVSDPAPGLPVLQGNVVVPLDLNHIGLALNAMFGAAVDTGSGDPYTHVFTSGAEALPWNTLEVAIKGVNSAIAYLQYIGLVGSKLTVDWSRAAGFAKATLEFMGRQENKLTSSAAGSPPAPYARLPVPEAIATVKFAGVNAAKITRFNATYDNKLSAQDFLGDPYVSGFDLAGESMFSGSLTLRFRDAAGGQTANQLYDLAVSQQGGVGPGIPVEDVSIGFALGSHSLSFDAPRVWFERTGVPIPGPGLIEQTFNFRAAQSVSVPMLTATLVSAVPSYNN